MRLLKRKSEVQVQKKSEYATAEDFCKVFQRDLDELLRLAVMLTGNFGAAEQTVMAALDDCRTASVFKPWAESWTRLAVIERAMKVAKPTDSIGRQTYAAASEAERDVPEEIEAVLRLDAFHRFVYVLTVLEKYSIRDCAILLKSGKQTVEAARRSAIAIVAANQKHLFVAADAHGFNVAASA